MFQLLSALNSFSVVDKLPQTTSARMHLENTFLPGVIHYLGLSEFMLAAVRWCGLTQMDVIQHAHKTFQGWSDTQLPGVLMN